MKNYRFGSWHLLRISGPNDFESEIMAVYQSSGRPADCEAYLQWEADSGDQIFWLSPAASDLASRLPKYQLSLESAEPAGGISAHPIFRKRSIFD
jgi:hypothetical protein